MSLVIEIALVRNTPNVAQNAMGLIQGTIIIITNYMRFACCVICCGEINAMASIVEVLYQVRPIYLPAV